MAKHQRLKLGQSTSADWRTTDDQQHLPLTCSCSSRAMEQLHEDLTQGTTGLNYFQYS